MTLALNVPKYLVVALTAIGGAANRVAAEIASRATKVDRVKQEAEEHAKKITDVLAQRDSHTWDSLIAPLEEVNDRLARVWSPVSHLNSVLNSEALRAAHDACLPLLSEFQTYVGQHEGLYQAYRELAESDDFPLLSGAQRKEIQNTLRDFRLSGIGLPEERKLVRRLLPIAQALGVPWVVTNNVHYAEPAARIVHDVLTLKRAGQGPLVRLHGLVRTTRLQP